jgi:hypothetical protein
LADAITEDGEQRLLAMVVAVRDKSFLAVSAVALVIVR